jgi:hypothetical protein
VSRVAHAGHRGRRGNIRLFDRASPGREGPWGDYARMETLLAAPKFNLISKPNERSHSVAQTPALRRCRAIRAVAEHIVEYVKRAVTLFSRIYLEQKLEEPN